jgi:adenylate kinase
MNLVIMGPPGAGKGTAAECIKTSYGLAHISTGDLLRAAVKAGTELGLKAAGYMNAGKLVPDDVVIGLVEHRLGEPDTKKGFMLDGFPRTIPQAEALAEMLDSIGRHLDLVLSIEVEDEEIIKRIAGRLICPACGAIFNANSNPPANGQCNCGGSPSRRKDDDPEAVKTRLSAYKAQTEPLIRWYSERGLLVGVDGHGLPAPVFKRISGILAGYEGDR